MIPWNEMVIRGEAKLLNVAGGFAKCIKMCNDCDYVVYNEYYSECFLIYYDHYGQKFNFITDDYQVSILFEERVSCHKPIGNTIVVDGIELKDCMQLCLTHPTMSCEAISYYPDRKCLLLTGTTSRDSNINIGTNCRQYRLNAIKFAGISRRKVGTKRKPHKLASDFGRAKAHGVNKKSQVK
ncbi:unnamed protein product [Strongylus vulgaris]|uniref:Uncharacterized protein n=1 Tax=Strongylus vulgaris TaxID=40348 RepID=A0A3P7J2L6_STRVU|nr:unnamed protein product [Strongylus vulgaris]